MIFKQQCFGCQLNVNKLQLPSEQRIRVFEVKQ